MSEAAAQEQEDGQGWREIRYYAYLERPYDSGGAGSDAVSGIAELVYDPELCHPGRILADLEEGGPLPPNDPPSTSTEPGD